MEYKHTQIGYLMISVTLILILATIITIIKTGFSATSAFLTAIVIILGSFSTLTVKIDEENLQIKFGYGIFFKNIPLNKIISATSTRNKWYYGWGIRILFRPRITIFNVSGFDAVEIKTDDKKIYRIGTDDSKKLEIMIRRAMGQTETQE